MDTGIDTRIDTEIGMDRERDTNRDTDTIPGSPRTATPLMPPPTCDVLVVGAGPAGSSAARVVAQAGFTCVLLDRNQAIGTPVRCAEGLTEPILDQLGIGTRDTDADPCTQRPYLRQRIRGTKLYHGDRHYCLTKSHSCGYTIDRKIFDKDLAYQAASAGARVFAKAMVIGIEDDTDATVGGARTAKRVQYRIGGAQRSIICHLIIGCDGFESTVGALTGLTRPWRRDRIFYGYEYECAGLDLGGEREYWHMIYHPLNPNGYLWIFPSSVSVANVGIVTTQPRQPKAILDTLVGCSGIVRKLIPERVSITETRAGAIPIGGPRPGDQLVGNGVVLAGDAGGFIEPIMGEGIPFAILSGIAAGRTALEALNADRAPTAEQYRSFLDATPYGRNSLLELIRLMHKLAPIFYRVYTQPTIPESVREAMTAALENQDDAHLGALMHALTEQRARRVKAADRHAKPTQV